jgi:hypothetical protein
LVATAVAQGFRQFTYFGTGFAAIMGVVLSAYLLFLMHFAASIWTAQQDHAELVRPRGALQLTSLPA